MAHLGVPESLHKGSLHKKLENHPSKAMNLLNIF